jgi:hypothetical protein
MASTHKSLRSGTANKRPTTSIADGQIALNTNTTSPGLFFKDSTGATIIKVGPVHVGTTAPNASPAAGGSSGNSTGEVWLDTSLTPVGVKIWNGSAFVNATPIGSTTVQGLLELATSAETQTGTDTDRAVTPAGLQSKVSDSISTTSSTTIASSTAVKSAYDLANAALPKSGGTVTGNLEIGTTGSLSFEGATADAFETTIAVTDPTADRTITLPDTTGTVVTTGDTGTVTSAMIADGTIVNADVNASAAIAGTKISPDFGSQTIATTGIVSHALGTAGAPTVTFTGDTNTGIYSPGADQVAISTNGTGRLFIDSSGNLGVGASSPGASLHVAGAITSAPTGSGLLAGINSNYGQAKLYGSTGGILDFGASGADAKGRILVNNSDSAIQFHTNNGSTLGERMRLDSSGRLGLGTSSVRGTSLLDARGDISFGSNATYYGLLSYNAATGHIETTSSDGGFKWIRQSGPATSMTLDSSGRLGIGTTSPSDKLHIDSGNIRITGSNPQYIQAVGINLNLNTDNQNILFSRSGTEMARFDSSSRFLVGTSSSKTVGAGQYSLLNVQGYVGASNGGGDITLSRGETASNITTGENLGIISFTDSAGYAFAQFACEADGTAGTNDYPGRLVFSTTADGASSPTERVRIGQGGDVLINRTSSAAGITNGCKLQVATNAADWTAHFDNQATSGANCFGVLINYTGASPNGTGNPFLNCSDTTTQRAAIRSNGGLANYSANNVNLSDRNAKKDIAPAAGTWDCLKEWEIVNFRYKDQPGDTDLNMGVIAQQVAESCPEVITVFQEAKEATETDPAQEERLGVKDQQMMWMAIKALQEAQLRIETLEAEVAALKGA